MKRRWGWIVAAVALLAAGVAWFLASGTAGEAARLAAEGGEIRLREPMRPLRGQTRVLLIALDGVGDGVLRELLRAGRLPRIAALLGPPEDDDTFAHAYAAPGALSILPSTTMAAWASVYTGAPASQTGVPGNEWYVREEMRFYAPGPISVSEHEHTLRMYTDDLIGRAIRVPTLFERADVRTHVSLVPVGRGADLLTAPALSDVGEAFGRLARGLADGAPVDRNAYRTLDESSVERVLQAFRDHQVPDLQVVYLPGSDLYTHVADPPLPEMERYLEEIVDPLVGRLLDAYAGAGLLASTYVVIVSDHGHTPVLMDDRHALGTGEPGEPPELIERAGYRMRPFVLEPDEDTRDYQAVVAYQGAVAYVYLADRSTCPDPGRPCSWMLPPRLDEDVLPLVRAFDRANRFGDGVPELRGTLDLILAREPRPVGEAALPFEVWDGERLVPIGDYLAANPRPDLLRFEDRMRDLAAGPYGHRAGDVLLLARSGMNRPITDRFYFSGLYHSWHGSPEHQDSRIPLLVARAGQPGSEIRDLVTAVIAEPPSQLDVVPLILRLLQQP